MAVTQTRDSKVKKLPGKPFLKGHAPFISSDANKIGRPRSMKTEVRDALKIAQDAMPGIILAMIARTTDPSVPVSVRQAASEYLCDRIYGRANQPLSAGEGNRLPTFAFIIPAGYQPMPGGLLSSKGEETKN